MDRETLIALRERVVNATGPDRGLDIHISHALGVDADWHGDLDNLGYNHLRGFCALGMRPLTASADAALALVERVLPGAKVGLDPIFFEDGEYVFWEAILCIPNWKQWRPTDSGWIERHSKRHSLIPLAILSALLSTLIAKETAG